MVHKRLNRRQIKELYGTNWDAISRQVKSDAGWKCRKCGHVHEHKSGYVLTTHHKDGNPKNNNKTNLIALCQRCHLQAQRILQPYIDPCATHK